MKTINTITKLTYLIILLALIAAGSGLLWNVRGNVYEYTAITGEVSLIHGGEGLYRYCTESIASQAIGQDVVTLFVGIPLLLIGLCLARKGSMRGQLILIGGLGYMLYTYASYSFGIAYNPMFLVYVAILALVLFTLFLSVHSIKEENVTQMVSEAMPRRRIAVYLIFLSAYLVLSWLGRIIPSLIKSQPPYGLETNTTLAIQVLDLAFVVPFCITAAILLWKNRGWGYILAAAILIFR